MGKELMGVILISFHLQHIHCHFNYLLFDVSIVNCYHCHEEHQILILSNLLSDVINPL